MSASSSSKGHTKGAYSRSFGRNVPPSVSVPPLPLLHRRLAIHSTTAGLIVRPYVSGARGHYSGQAVKVAWGTLKPEVVEQWSSEENGEDPITDGLVVDGLAGLLEGFQRSFLLAITDSAVVATLPDSQKSKVNVANSLIAIPISSFESARSVLEKYAAKQANRRRSTSVSSVSTAGTGARAGGNRAEDDSDDSSSSSEDEADASPISLPSTDPKRPRPFWQRSFRFGNGKKPAASSAAVEEVAKAEQSVPVVDSTKSTPPSDDSTPGGSPDPNKALPPNGIDGPGISSVAAAATHVQGATDEEVRASQRELDQKLVAECLRTFTGLYFSYDADITRSLQAKHERNAESTVKHLPLWRTADRRFWFNSHVMQPFVQAGLHSYIIVLQQGFAQQTTVPLPLQPYKTLTSAPDPTSPASIDLDLTIISRRSIERAGLRYQRRGINASGGTANFVETEFIVSCVRDGTRHVDSFVQVRGSIPLYWSQSPWALKPPPVLERTKEESREAMKKHLDGLHDRYGRLVLVNLAEQTGREGSVVEAYRSGVESLKKEESEVRYVSFDFHNECRGMRYENISKLIEDIREDLEELQTFWTTDSETYSVQNGVCRVNCIDSLDRTNVVQSAIARWVLNRHLVNLAITSGADDGMHDELDVAFNNLFANNGDAISRAYAGTSALKGDFTRTGKRDWRGQLNDASNSVARLLSSTTSDFFKQAALEYFLGINTNAFQEFTENLETRDPENVLRLAKIRQEAIETSTREVVADGETKIAAWTLLSPSEPDVVRPGKNGKYEEKVLVLSNKAVYVVAYEFNLQKVVAFTRIPTGDILGLQHGAFILSALDGSTRDPVENYGFILKYHDHNSTDRSHTYSLRTTTSPKKTRQTLTIGGSGIKPLKLPFALSVSSNKDAGASTPASTILDNAALEDRKHFIAFKALRRDAVRVASSDGSSQFIDQRASSDDVEGKTAKDLVLSIVSKFEEEGKKVGVVEEGWVVEKDVISLTESKAQTSIVDKMKRDLYRMVWL